ncbi:hypothetical protein JCM3765_007164 [Sporobolomyces pararoseus]
MELPKSILRNVIEHLDPSEGGSTTKALSSLCLVSKLVLDLARPQLYSTIRIDDMRCVRDYARASSNREVYSQWSEEQKAGQPIWLRTLYREKELKVRRREWEERQKVWREQREGGGEEDAKMNDNDNSEGEEEEEDHYHFYEPDIFDDADQDTYAHADDDPPLPKLHYLNWGPTDILDPFSYQLLFTLEAHPHLAQLVKAIDLHGRVEGKPTSIIIERFLTVCPNIETILLYRGPVRKIADACLVLESIKKRAPGIKNLEVIDFDNECDRWLYEEISKLPNLSHLSLTCTPREPIAFYPRDFPLRSLATRNLTSLHLGSIAVPEFFEQIPDYFLESITSLGIAVRRDPPNLSLFKRLRHLTVTFGYLSHATEALETLSSTNEINSLELRFSERIESTENGQRQYEDRVRHQMFGFGFNFNEETTGGGTAKRGLDSFIDLFDHLPTRIVSLSLPWSLSRREQKEFRTAVETKLPPSTRKIRLLASMGDSDPEMSIRKQQERSWLLSTSRYLEQEKGVEVYRVQHWDGGRSERGALARFGESQRARAR